MPALCLVPRVALNAVETLAQILNIFHSLGNHAREEHKSCCGVLKPRPSLGVVGKWDAWARPLSIIADNHRRLFVERVGSLHGVMVNQTALVVIAVDRVEGGAHVLG